MKQKVFFSFFDELPHDFAEKKRKERIKELLCMGLKVANIESGFGINTIFH